MKKSFEEQEVKTIWRWIELYRIDSVLVSLENDTSEAIEDDDFAGWISGENTSVFGEVHSVIHNCEKRIYKKLEKIEKKLYSIITLVVKEDERLYESKEKIGESVKRILDDIKDKFDSIYEYNNNDELENFLKVLGESMSRLAFEIEQKKNNANT